MSNLCVNQMIFRIWDRIQMFYSFFKTVNFLINKIRIPTLVKVIIFFLLIKFFFVYIYKMTRDLTHVTNKKKKKNLFAIMYLKTEVIVYLYYM